MEFVRTANEAISSIAGVMSFKIYQQPANIRAYRSVF